MSDKHVYGEAPWQAARDRWGKSSGVLAILDDENPEDYAYRDLDEDVIYHRRDTTDHGTEVSDPVNHPSHYNWLPVEVIDITEHLNFCMGNAVKYILRADHKGNPIQDLEKAAWYVKRELERRKQ